MASTSHVEESRMSPRYLHSNSTSHVGPFSAIAELIDNAYDPDCQAKDFHIDLEKINNHRCLIFTDNGSGVDYSTMVRMMSFGFCEKAAVGDHKPVGHYGNGFKSGSMRLGRDALVLSRCGDVETVGLLSQTYLEKVNATSICVPMFSWSLPDRQIMPMGSAGVDDAMYSAPAANTALPIILENSPLRKREEIVEQMNIIAEKSANRKSRENGTRIIIFNLRVDGNNEMEFDATSDPHDLHVARQVTQAYTDRRMVQARQSAGPDEPSNIIHTSLRAYCEVLYGKPRMSIHIRGKKVQTRYLERMLDRVEYDSYRPMTVMRQDMVRIVFGLAESKDSPYGMMLYHNNRLIKGYYHMGLQARAEAVGVVGVIDCPFLQPTHNKQEFDGSQQYQAFLKSLQAKLKDYWYRLTHREVKDSITGKVVREENVAVTFRKQSASDVRSAATDLWVQCDQCKKWRKLSKQLDTDTAGGEWYCFMNEDPLHSDCNHPEENEDSCDADAPRKKITRAPKRPSIASERERDRKEQEAKMQRDKQALEEREERLRQKEKMMARQQRAEKRASEAANHEAVSPVEEHATAHASPEMAAGLASPAASPDNRDFAIAPPPDPASLHGLFTDSEDTPAADGFIRESIVKMEPVDGQPAMNKCAVQCCKCSKWRQVPVSAFYNLSDAMLWECSMNPDPRMCDSCQFPQAIRSSAVACLDARCKKPYRPQAASARTRAASSVSDTDAESLASRELATSPEVANMMPTATTGQMDMPSASTLTTATTRPGPNNHTTATGNSLQQADNSDNTTGSDNDEDYTFPSSGIFSPTPAVNTYSDGNTMAEGLDRASETDSAPSPPLLQGADEDEYDGAFTAAEVVSASNAPAPTPTAAEQGRRARTVTARAVSGPAAESIRRDAQSRHWVTSSRKRPSTVQAYGSDSTGAEESADSRQPPAKQAWTRLTPGRATAGEQPDQLPATEGTSNQQRDSDQMDAEEDYAGERERDLESKLRESEECCNQLTQEMGKQQQQHDDQCKRLQDQVAHLEAKLRERTEELEDARRKIEQQEAELSKAKTKTRQLSRSTTIKREPTAVILLG